MSFPLLPLRARLVAAPALLCLTVLAACTRADLPSTTEPVTGPGFVYTLVSVDSRSLPATVTVESNQYRVVSGKLTLSPDSSFILSNAITGPNPAGGISTGVTTVRGTYSRTDGEIVLVQGSSEAFRGSYADNLVILSSSSSQVIGTSFRFTR